MVFDCPTYPPQSQSYGPNCAFSTDPSCWPSSAQHLQVATSCYEGDRFSTPEAVHGLRDSYLEHEPGLLHYCDGNFTTSPGCETGNWQVKSDLTYFYDSPGSFYVETTRSDPDGYGHYKTTTSSSNSPGSVDHKVHVSYRPAVGPQTWLLGLSDGMTVTENGQTSQETYTFDRATGFLVKKTTQRAGGNLVATFTPDAFGNVETETYSGGDPGHPAYAVENVYEHGTLSLSQYVRSGRTILRTVDADIDKNTGLPKLSRDESGLETTYSFDAQGRLTHWIPTGALAEAPTTYTYTKADPNRSPADKRASVAVDRADTHSQVFFDGLGRVNEMRATLPGGTVNRRFTTFTPMGQPDTVTTLHPSTQPGTARMTRMDYDVFGRPTRIRNPDDGLASTGVSQTFMTYDGIFKTVRWIKDVETPEGAQKLLTKYLYDHQGRLLTVEETDSEGANTDLKLRTRYLYDEGGRLVQVNQGAGTQIRTFDYDGAGLLTKERHPELGGGSIVYSGYDALGNATRLRYSKTGGDPFELDYRFDGAGRLTQVKSVQNQRLLKEFFYNNFYGSVVPPSPAAGNGKLYQAKRHNYVGPLDIVATVTNTYAGFGGRLSRRTVTTGGDGDVPRVRFTTDFSYDSLGNPTSLAYPSCLQAGCDGSVPGRQVTRTFTRGLLTGVGTSANATRYAALSYHPNATVAQVLHGNGVRDVITEDPSQLPRPAGIEVRTGATAGAGTLWDADYQYDGAGNVASRTSHGFTSAGAPLFSGTDLFRYDNAFNRLVSATIHYPAGAGGATESREYAYDAFGNLTSISGSNPRTLSPDPTTNRLQSPVTYDDAGNLTSQPGWYYDYDPLNMMVHAQKAGGSIDRRFLYTADDERLAILTPGRELWTLRDNGNSVLRDVEYLSTGWRWVEDYVHGSTGLLATLESVGGEKHYHLDHLGSPRLVTNAAKQVVARHVLAPYGEELTSTNQDELRMKFTGHERDAMDPFDGDGDLDYMHARYCSAQVGRFLSVDPSSRRMAIRRPQRWNRYAYALSNPLIYVDPDGRDVIYQKSKDEQFYTRLAARSARVSRVFAHFAPETGRNLYINRGAAGRFGFGGGKGERKAANTDLTATPNPPEAFREAYDSAGGGQAGMAAAEALGDYYLSEATITLTSDATDFNKAHELGHVEEGILDPLGAIESGEEANALKTREEYEAHPSEVYADEFAVDVLDDNEPERE
jgi:RHS repeat-associated protein